MEQITRRLAQYVLESKFEDIPEMVRHETKRSLINFIGVTIGGARHEAVEIALAALAEFSGPPTATLLGRSEKMDILHASLINGIASTVLDFDATQYKLTNIHPSGLVLPAILALAERTPFSGAELLHTFLLGVEVECRLANVIFGKNNPGWHVSGAVGGIGAAAGAGRLLGLDEDQLTRAYGIAATQPGGIREMYGTMCKSFTPGRACQNGLASALLAGKGFGSSEASIEAPMGFAKVLMNVTELDGLTENLGTEFEIMYNMYKPFACAIVLHPIIDGCIQLRNEHSLTADQIKSVALRVNPNVVKLAGRENPNKGLLAKFSFSHVTALALVHGAAGEPQFTDALANDPTLGELRQKVTATVEDAIVKDETHISITLTDGTTLERHVPHAIGSLENPMSDQDIEGKFISLVEPVLGKDGAERLLGLCWGADELKDGGDIARATAP
jgi:2-methylcitrate dehydratase PrpD